MPLSLTAGNRAKALGAWEVARGLAAPGGRCALVQLNLSENGIPATGARALAAAAGASVTLAELDLSGNGLGDAGARAAAEALCAGARCWGDGESEAARPRCGPLRVVLRCNGVSEVAAFEVRKDVAAGATTVAGGGSLEGGRPGGGMTTPAAAVVLRGRLIHVDI